MSSTLEQLPAAEFARVTCAEEFRDWFEECAEGWEYRVSVQPDDRKARWSEDGTWITPPLQEFFWDHAEVLETLRLAE